MAWHTTVTVTLTWDQLARAADMLNYDRAYKVTREGSRVQISLLDFTPERWESFGVAVVGVPYERLNDHDYHEAVLESNGIAIGLRLALAYHQENPLENHYLAVEGGI